MTGHFGTFDKNLKFPENVKTRNRTDVLMNGHRFQADARSTFCNSCNLSMVNSFGIAANYKSGVDIIMTGDSDDEQKAYYAWVRQLARGFGLSKPETAKGFGSFLQTLDGISDRYFSNLYGENKISRDHRITCNIPRNPKFFNIYEDTSYHADHHWELLTDFLGFVFDELMFSFSESDCGNPSLMAHIRGLRSETLLGLTYDEGVAQYMEFAVGLMVQKQFPQKLISIILERYATSATRNRQRQLSEKYALEAFNLTTTNLICMIYSPFTQEGENLTKYLKDQKIDCPVSDIHSAIKGERNSTKNICLLLEKLSGLTINNIRQCYRNNLVPSLLKKQEIKDPMSIILRHDPHKTVIQSLNSKAKEIISGR